MATRRYIFFKLVLFAIVLPLASCGDKDEKSDLPAYVIDRNKLTAILTDMHLVEAALVEKQHQGALSFDLSEIYYDTLFAKYSVTRMQLDSSIAHYSRNPAVLDAIYVNVITNLSKIQSEPPKSHETEHEFLLEPESEADEERDVAPEEEIEPVWLRKKDNPWLN
jgi:hypothetical protein